MPINNTYQAIFEQIQSMQARLGASDSEVGHALQDLIHGSPVEAPFDTSETDIDALYRLAWAFQIREIAYDTISLVTNAMRLDLLRGSGTSLTDVFSDLSASARYHPAWLFGPEDPALVPSWVRSANASREVLDFSGPDLRLLVDRPMGDWLGDDRADRWSEGASERALNLLERGDLGEDYAQPSPDDLEALVERALQYDAHDRLEEALAALDGAALLNSGRAQSVRGQIFRRRGMQEEAIEASTLALEAGVEDPAVEHYNRAVALGNLGETDQAIEDYARAIELDAEWADPHRNRGCLLLRRGDLDASRINLSRAVEIEPEDPTHLYNLALVQSAQGDDTEAVSTLDLAIEIDSDYAEAYNNRGILRRQLGDLSGAIEDFSACIERLDSPTSLINRASAHAELGGESLEGAITDYTALLERYPGDGEFMARRGAAYEAVGRRAQAISDYTCVLRAVEVDAEHIDTAQEGLTRLDYTGPKTYPWPESPTLASVRHYSATISDEVWETTTRLAMEAQQTWRSQGPQAAILIWDEVLDALPGWVEPWVRRGLMHLELGQPDKALADIERAQAVAPLADLPHAARADIFSRMDDLDHALEAIDQAIERSPFDTDYLARRAALQEASGDIGAALGTYRDILAIEPANTNALYNMACAHTKDGQNALAIEVYTQLLHIDPTDTQALLNRGAIRMDTEGQASAFEDWNRANDIDPFYAFPYAKRGISHLSEGRHWHSTWELGTALLLAPEGWIFFEQTQTAIFMASGPIHEDSLPLPEADLLSFMTRFEAIGDQNITMNFLQSIKPLASESGEFWRLLGDAHHDIGEDKEASESWRAAIDLNPDCSSAHIQLAHLARREANHTQAIEHFHKALETHTPQDTWDLKEARTNLAGVLISADRRPEAIDIWTSLLTEDPEDTHTLFRLAFEQDLDGQREASIQTYTRLIAIDPSHSTAWFNRACGHGILGHRDEAISDLTTAIDLDESWRAKAAEESYFDPIRDDPGFEALTRAR